MDGQADVQAVKEALNSAVDVLNAVEGSVQFLLPKVRGGSTGWACSGEAL